MDDSEPSLLYNLDLCLLVLIAGDVPTAQDPSLPLPVDIEI